MGPQSWKANITKWTATLYLNSFFFNLRFLKDSHYCAIFGNTEVERQGMRDVRKRDKIKTKGGGGGVENYWKSFRP